MAEHDSTDGGRGTTTGELAPAGRSRYLTLDRIAQLRGSDGAIAATLEALADHRGRVEVTYEDLAAAAGTSRNTAYRSVQRLKFAGILLATRRAYRSLAIAFVDAPHHGGDERDGETRCADPPNSKHTHTTPGQHHHHQTNGAGWTNASPDVDGRARPRKPMPRARVKATGHRAFPCMPNNAAANRLPGA
jgi:hypothetical protein